MVLKFQVMLVREGLTEVTSEQRTKLSKETSHSPIWRSSIQGRGNSKYKGSAAKYAPCETLRSPACNALKTCAERIRVLPFVLALFLCLNQNICTFIYQLLLYFWNGISLFFCMCVLFSFIIYFLTILIIVQLQLSEISFFKYNFENY